MATGDQSDIAARLQRLIPFSWFPYGLAPLYFGVIAGCSAVFAEVYSLLTYVKNQTRLQTTSDGFLDLTAQDYFGSGLPRRNGELDPSYQLRIQLNLIRRRNTRPAVIKILEDLTGRAPTIYEPRRPADTGGYGSWALAYGAAGAYGSRALPAQAFVTAYRPIGQGVPNVAGYGVPVGGYRVGGQLEYASSAQSGLSVADADIYAAVESVRPAGRILWVRISS